MSKGGLLDFDFVALIKSWALISVIVTIALCTLFYVTSGKSPLSKNSTED